LGRLCKNETSLYRQFFSTDSESDDDKFLVELLFKLCGDLHSSVRKGLVKLNDLDTLCQIVSVLREEEKSMNGGSSLGDLGEKKSKTKSASSQTLNRVIKDAQERIIFCSSTTLQKEVIGFKITPPTVDYPNKLITSQQRLQDAIAANDLASQMEIIYDAWFPPLKSTLAILSKIFRVVEMTVFDDFALFAVKECSLSMRRGMDAIVGDDHEMDRKLFYIKHLLLLREQLVPFDIQLRTVSRSLDFSKTGEAITKFLNTSKQKLFSVNLAENSLVHLGADVVGM